MLIKRFSPLYALPAIGLLTWLYFYNYLDLETGPDGQSQSGSKTGWSIGLPSNPFTRPPPSETKFHWSERPETYPVSSMIPLPEGLSVKIPRIQHHFEQESEEVAGKNYMRRNAVRKAFNWAWNGYKKQAWMKDEVTPLTGNYRKTFGGWGATLVDSLDTLWLMNMRDDFVEAVDALKDIDFSKSEDDELNTFETNIRYLGGLLAAYDLSGAIYPILLDKALELGDMLYAAFDTPNRMPIAKWHWRMAQEGQPQEASFGVLASEIGSFALEFTRLSQLTGDPKFYDAIQRVTDQFQQQQSMTKLPGMWPYVVNAQTGDFTADSAFTLGTMADSFYEYLPKEYLLLGGMSLQYRTMYQDAIDVAKKHLFFRPMAKEDIDVLISGNVRANSPDDVVLDPQGQHLSCYIGGMVGIGAKIFNRPDELAIARKLVDGCIWAHQSMPAGIMPEKFHVVPCKDATSCKWDESKWYAGVAEWHESFNVKDSQKTKSQKIKELRLHAGFTDMTDRRYLLRPETIESMFILYRITGDESLRDDAWKMFELVDLYTHADFGNAALSDVTQVPGVQSDDMASYWMAETLKYYYLMFSDQDVVSLDHYVFNTEAHPLKRPQTPE